MQLADIGLSAARDASDYIRSQANQKHDLDFKSGLQSLSSQVVTEIDLKSQKLILDKLQESMDYYDLGILSEEMQDNGSRFKKSHFWCIDPLDGTLPFTEQQPGYAVTISLINAEGNPIIGIVIDPYHDHQYVAIKGEGCKYDGKDFQLTLNNESALICNFDRSFLQASNYDQTIDQLNQVLLKLGLQNLKIVTGPGSVMNALGLLNAGYGCYLKLPKANLGGGCIWDFAATSLIFNELGMEVSDSFGRRLKLNKKDSLYMNKEGILFATDTKLYNLILQMIRR